jgi:hypothetical protein
MEEDKKELTWLVEGLIRDGPLFEKTVIFVR